MSDIKLMNLLKEVGGAISPEIDGMRKRAAVNEIYKNIKHLLRGLYKDNGWQGVQKIWKEFEQMDLDWHIEDSFYGLHKHDNTFPPERKVWVISIDFLNNRGNKQEIGGRVVAAGVSKPDDPLRKYDLTVSLG